MYYSTFGKGKTKKSLGKNTLIITGQKGEGKTTKIKQLTELLKIENIQFGGVIATAVYVNGERNTYRVESLNTSKNQILCTSVPSSGLFIKEGNFYFDTSAVELYNKEIQLLINSKSVIIIDEIGPMEMRGKIWAPTLKMISESDEYILLITVRESIVVDVIEKFRLQNVTIFTINDSNDLIIKKIKNLF